MRLGLVSDSHGELANLREAAKKLRAEWQVDIIAHLGDEWPDADVLREHNGLAIIQVPGVYGEYYQDPAIINRVLREINGYRILFTHTRDAHANDLPGDPDPAELAGRGEVDIVAYGHTHIPEVELKGKVLWVNPGHLKKQDKKGLAPSFGVVDLEADRVTVHLVDLNSGVVFRTWEGSLKQ
jgi:hypothetical protein